MIFVNKHLLKVNLKKWVASAIIFLTFVMSSSASANFCQTARVSIEINASAQVVFQTITDVASYPDWNPFILRVEPDGIDITAVGTQFDLIVPNPLGFGILRSPEITTVSLEPNLFRNGGIIRYQSTIASAEQLGGPVRAQIVSKIDSNKTLYETEETFCGVFSSFSYEFALEGFEAQTAALKVEAERRASRFW